MKALAKLLFDSLVIILIIVDYKKIAFFLQAWSRKKLKNLFSKLLFKKKLEKKHVDISFNMHTMI